MNELLKATTGLFSDLFCIAFLALLFIGELNCAIASGVVAVVLTILEFTFSVSEADREEQAVSCQEDSDDSAKQT